MLMERLADGTLPGYAWPGGYPIVYLTRDHAMLCATCASEPDDSDPVVAHYIHWEGPAELCDECNTAIASAYGESSEE